MTDSNQLAAHYQCLNLPMTATAAEVDHAYFSLRAEKIQAGDRQSIAALKTARETIKSSLETAAKKPNAPTSSPSESANGDLSPIETLVAALSFHELNAKVSLREGALNLGILVESMTPSQVAAKVRQVLGEAASEDYGISKVETVAIYGLDSKNKALWKKTFPLAEISSKRSAILRRFS